MEFKKRTRRRRLVACVFQLVCVFRNGAIFVRRRLAPSLAPTKHAPTDRSYRNKQVVRLTRMSRLSAVCACFISLVEQGPYIQLFMFPNRVSDFPENFFSPDFCKVSIFNCRVKGCNLLT